MIATGAANEKARHHPKEGCFHHLVKYTHFSLDETEKVKPFQG